MKALLLTAVAALALSACSKHDDSNTTAMTTDSNAMANEAVATDTGNAMAANTMGAMQNDAASFVMNAAQSDMYEIAAGKMAASKATSADLKKFGTMMVEAHTATTAGLKAAIAKGGVKVTPPTAPDAEHQAMLDELKAKTGADFDATYLAQQRTAHTKALSLMQEYAASGDNDALKAFAADTAPKVQSHLDMLGKM